MIDVSTVSTAAFAVLALCAHVAFCGVLYLNLPRTLRPSVYAFLVAGPVVIIFLATAKGESARHILMLWSVAAVSGVLGCAGQRRRFAIGAASGGRLKSPEQVNAAWAIMIRIFIPLAGLLAFLYLKVSGWQ